MCTNCKNSVVDFKPDGTMFCILCNGESFGHHWVAEGEADLDNLLKVQKASREFAKTVLEDGIVTTTVQGPRIPDIKLGTDFDDALHRLDSNLLSRIKEKYNWKRFSRR